MVVVILAILPSFGPSMRGIALVSLRETRKRSSVSGAALASASVRGKLNKKIINLMDPQMVQFQPITAQILKVFWHIGRFRQQIVAAIFFVFFVAKVLKRPADVTGEP